MNELVSATIGSGVGFTVLDRLLRQRVLRRQLGLD